MGNVAREHDMSIGTNLRRLRDSKGLTQDEVASAAGIPGTTYKSYEKDRLTPPGDRVAALARALAVSADEILLDEDEQAISEDLRPIFRQFELLPDDVKRQAKIALRGILLGYQQETLR